jgi:hypothetical protein
MEKTLVAMVRVPERVARGMLYGEGSLAWCVLQGVGAVWESDFEDTETAQWAADVKRLFGCAGADREAMRELDAGFVEAGGEAERTIAGLVAERAEADREKGEAVAAGWEWMELDKESTALLEKLARAEGVTPGEKVRRLLDAELKRRGLLADGETCGAEVVG